MLLVCARAGHTAEPWTLERAVAHALANNPEARMVEYRIAAARAGLQQANAAFRPQVQIESSYTRTDNPIGVFGAALNQRSYAPSLDFNNVPDADNLNLRGVLTVPLYSGGRSKAGRERARANTQAARENAAAVRHLLAFEVTRGFPTLVKTRQFIGATEAAVRAFESNLNTASNRLSAGSSLRTEVLDMEVRLAQAREHLVRARNAHLLAGRSLRNLLGLEQSEGNFPVEEVVPVVPEPALSEREARPELIAMQHRLRAAEAEVWRARGSYKPRLDAFGSLDYDRGWKFHGEGKSYTAGVFLRWDLWDGQLTRGKIYAARAEVDLSREEERKLRLAIDLEVEEARLDLQEAIQRLAVTDKAVAQALESAELTRSRYNEGLAIATQLIDAETALTAARVRRAEAEGDRRIAIAALRKALGLPQLPEANTP
jgi:outer membrane protein TolC